MLMKLRPGLVHVCMLRTADMSFHNASTDQTHSAVLQVHVTQYTQIIKKKKIRFFGTSLSLKYLSLKQPNLQKCSVVSGLHFLQALLDAENFQTRQIRDIA